MIGENAMKDSELIQKVHSGNKEAVGIIMNDIMQIFIAFVYIWFKQRMMPTTLLRKLF